MTEYDVVEESSAVRLKNAVNKMILAGWVPLGGVSSFWNLSGYYYNQAMTRTNK
jgi:hypothetical protein